MCEQTAPKGTADSRAEQVQIVMNEQTTVSGRLFGGRLMEWIDVVAAVVARRHSGKEVTTAAIDNLSFRSAAYIGDTVVLRGQITYVGNTSMEVRVDTYTESLGGESHLVNRAYLVLVALDENAHPSAVPPFQPVTEEEFREWEAGKRRRELRRQRELQQF